MSSPFVQAPVAGNPVHYDAVAIAQQRLRANRREGLVALDALFRAGALPNPPPDGPYHGELIAVDIAPVVTPLVE